MIIFQKNIHQGLLNDLLLLREPVDLARQEPTSWAAWILLLELPKNVEIGDEKKGVFHHEGMGSELMVD